MEKIIVGCEYFNEAHEAWLPVPIHWLGTSPQSWTHKIRFPVNRGGSTVPLGRENCKGPMQSKGTANESTSRPVHRLI